MIIFVVEICSLSTTPVTWLNSTMVSEVTQTVNLLCRSDGTSMEKCYSMYLLWLKEYFCCFFSRLIFDCTEHASQCTAIYHHNLPWKVPPWCIIFWQRLHCTFLFFCIFVCCLPTAFSIY
jgi:hypothetical protein